MKLFLRFIDNIFVDERFRMNCNNFYPGFMRCTLHKILYSKTQKITHHNKKITFIIIIIIISLFVLTSIFHVYMGWMFSYDFLTVVFSYNPGHSILEL